MATRDRTRAQNRADREREIVDATRALFDERGMQDAGIEDIARAVGINKALIYRHFQSKDELYVLTLTRYLDEIGERLDAVPLEGDPAARFRRISEIYVDYCLQYPAFLDCALAIMRRPFAQLGENVSQAVLFRLGQSMAATLARSHRVLVDGTAAGVFAVGDPAQAANVLYAHTLGMLHLARIGVGVKPAQAGFPEVFAIDAAYVREACVEGAMRLVLA